jgi:hypothetical protein
MSRGWPLLLLTRPLSSYRALARRRSRSRSGLRRAERLLALWCAASVIMGAQSVAAQIINSTGADPKCRCRIVLHRVAQVGSGNDAAAIPRASVAARDSKGQFYVASPQAESSFVAVYSARGTLVGRRGKSGRGPGELDGIHYIRITAGDSLVVLDDRRLSVFAPDGKFVRSNRLPDGRRSSREDVRAFTFVTLTNGDVLVNNHVAPRPAFVLLDRHFLPKREFGPPVAESRSGLTEALHAIARLPNGRIAAARQNHIPVLELWDTSGARVSQYFTRPTWFPEWTDADEYERGPRSPPLPRILGLYPDSDERLWLAALVPDLTWKPAALAPKPNRGREVPYMPPPISDYPKYYDTVVEVIDPASGRVIVSQRFDEYLPFFMEGGLLYGYRQTAGRGIQIVVWRPELVRH